MIDFVSLGDTLSKSLSFATLSHFPLFVLVFSDSAGNVILGLLLFLVSLMVGTLLCSPSRPGSSQLILSALLSPDIFFFFFFSSFTTRSFATTSTGSKYVGKSFHRGVSE